MADSNEQDQYFLESLLSEPLPALLEGESFSDSLLDCFIEEAQKLSEPAESSILVSFMIKVKSTYCLLITFFSF